MAAIDLQTSVEEDTEVNLDTLCDLLDEDDSDGCEEKGSSSSQDNGCKNNASSDGALAKQATEDDETTKLSSNTARL